MQVGLAHRESLNKSGVVKGFKYKPLIRESLLKVLSLWSCGPQFSDRDRWPYAVEVGAASQDKLRLRAPEDGRIEAMSGQVNAVPLIESLLSGAQEILYCPPEHTTVVGWCGAAQRQSAGIAQVTDEAQQLARRLSELALSVSKLSSTSRAFSE